MIFDAHQFATGKFGNHLVRNHLVAFFVGSQIEISTFSGKVGAQACLRQEVGGRFAGVGVVAFHRHILNFRSHAEGSVGRKGPRRGGPSNDAEFFESGIHFAQYISHHRIAIVFHGKLCGNGLVLHIAIAARLVQLVTAQSGACSGRVGLNGVALVE